MTAAGDPRRGVSEIRVAQGTYLPDRDEITPNGSGDRKDSFALIDGVALRGGFAGLAGLDPNERDSSRFESMLSGLIAAHGADCYAPHDGPGCGDPACAQAVCQFFPMCCTPGLDWSDICASISTVFCQKLLQDPSHYPFGSDHVVAGIGVERSAVLDGFTITCRDLGPQPAPDDCVGRGVHLLNGSPQIVRCRFVDSEARAADAHSGAGAAMANIRSSPLISQCIFTKNRARNGGAIWNEDSSPTIVDCVFVGNQADVAGGAIDSTMCSPTIVGCVFDRNQGGFSSDGGAIHNAGGSSTITNCRFSSNLTRSGRGGAVKNLDSDVRIISCTFESSEEETFLFGGNANEGGAIFQDGATLTLEDCTFTGLIGRERGGSIASVDAQRISSARCIFSENRASIYGGAVYLAGSGRHSFDDCAFHLNTSATYGGAIASLNASNLSARGCAFDRNRAGHGGAVYLAGAGLSSFDDCDFKLNSVGEGFNSAGGALYAYDSDNLLMQDCRLSNNFAWSAGGAALLYETTAIFEHCTFNDNEVANFYGGAVYTQGNLLFASHCEFHKNSAPSSGGAVYGNDADLQFDMCRFTANRTTSSIPFAGWGGAVYCESSTNCAARSCLFIGNAANGQYGGAFILVDGSSAELLQCTLAFNSAGTAGGGACIFDAESQLFMSEPSHASIVNSILWNNTDSLGMSEQSQLAVAGPGADAFAVSHSCIQGWSGALGGVGNIGDDPLFIDPLGRDGEPGGSDADLRLAPRSPCIDAGDTSAVCGVILTDLDGEPRIKDGDRDRVFIVDMGAYEAPGQALPASDLNCDGVIDSLDLGILLSSWSNPPESPGCGGSVPCAADLNHDGVVDSLDLGILLAGWTLKEEMTNDE